MQQRRRRCMLSVAAIFCAVLSQSAVVLATERTHEPLAGEGPSLPVTSDRLHRWWHNETVATASLAQRVVLDVAALLTGSTAPPIQRRVDHSACLVSGEGEVRCICDCSLSDPTALIMCSLCRRIHLRVRSSSSAILRQPSRSSQPLRRSTVAAFDTALSTSLSASHAPHCPALHDSYSYFTRLHYTLLTSPQRLHGLFPLVPTTSSATPNAADSAGQQLSHLSHLTAPTWLSASNGGGGGGGLGYQVRCGMGDDEGVLLWSIGGGGGGGYRATSQRVGGSSWNVQWKGGSGGGAGLQWDGYSVGGGGGGGWRLEASLSPSSAPHFTYINASQGAQPDATHRRLPSASTLISLNRTLASRMRHCIRLGHTLHIVGGGGAGGGHQLRVRLRGGEEDKGEQMEVHSRLHHSLAFHFELTIDRRALSAWKRDGERAQQ